MITEGFGTKEGEPPATGFELRASWCPVDDDDFDRGDVAAWCELIAKTPAGPPRALLAISRRAPGRGLAGPAGGV